MKVRVLINVPITDPGNYLGRAVQKGEEFFVFEGHDYGCVDRGVGVPLSEIGTRSYPFFEFPKCFVEEVE